MNIRFDETIHDYSEASWKMHDNYYMSLRHKSHKLIS